MNRKAAIAAIAFVILQSLGVGMHIPHPVWFSSEPIVVASKQATPPTLLPPREHNWVRLGQEATTTEWALLLYKTQGVIPLTIRADGQEQTVIVVPDRFAILEVYAPPYVDVQCDSPNLFFQFDFGVGLKAFVLKPGPVEIELTWQSGRSRIERVARSGTRITIDFNPTVSVSPVTSTFLPSTEICLAMAKIETPLPIKSFNVTLSHVSGIIPKAWLSDTGIEVYPNQNGWIVNAPKPLSSFEIQFPAFLSPSVELGRHELSFFFDAFEVEKIVEIEVKRCLPPVEAVLRWNPETREIEFDKPLPPAPTADQLAWAVVWSESGQAPPYACRVLTAEELGWLASLFEDSE